MKNLTAHRTKNRKTSIMYSLSIGIFIMVSVGLDIIVQSTKKSYLNLKGSEITLSQNYFKPKDLIEPLKELYDKELIESFTFRTAEFSEVCFKSTIQVENIGKSLYYTTYLNGISPEYFSTTEKSDLKIAEQNETYNKYNPSEQLYLKDYIGKVGLSALFTFHFDLHINTDFYINLKNQNEEIKFITKPAFLLNGAAGIYVNSIPSSYWQRTNIISIPLFLDYLTKCTNYFSPSLKDMIDYNYDNVPIDFINLKLNDKKPIKESSEEIIKIFSNAKNINADIWLFENRRDRLDTISNIAFNIFYSVSSIVLFFCFFNLTASMTINLFAQKKEIAIMRSLGMKKKHVIFVFVSEAIILILTSSLIGTFIGSLISYTMGLQWEMFTYQNVQFNLKISNLVFVVLFSIFGGILSTILPAKKMLDTPIPQLIREI
jgi:ABC-type antimicrobial peptide transport system permease subunit